MAAKPLPSQEVLRQLLDYDPETGALRWKLRHPSWFPDGGKLTQQAKANAWNAKWAGRLITFVDADGYSQLRVFNVLYRAHRVIWKMMTGLDPENIDHIDGARTNNSWGNLRDVSRVENQRNQKRSAANTTGISGVYWDNRRCVWTSRIRAGEKNLYLGQFKEFQDAVDARKRAEILHGYHANHGRDG